MIYVNDKSCQVKGNIKKVFADWMDATKTVYYVIAQELGLKEASKLFIKGLQVAANYAAKELKEKGKLPDE